MDEIKKLYIDFDKNLRLKRSIVGCILSITLMPAGISLDYFLYPEFLKTFTTIRFICSFFTVLVLLLHYTEFGKKNIRYLTFVWLVFIPISICWMIFVTDGYLSTYYAGLNLVILATAVVLPFTTLEMIIFCTITILLYLISAIRMPLENGGMLFNNVYFLVLTSIISTTSAYVNSRFRFSEFCLNYELKDALEKLRSAQAQLVHSEKINAIGNLSAGLLHEVNNPLNYTLTAVQLIKMDPHISQDEDLKDTVKDIEDGMNRIKTIVTDLRAFAYPEEADKKQQFPIHQAIESALRFTASETKDIEKIIEVPHDLIVSASKTHIVQVLINLVSNGARAIHKTDKKGILIIKAKAEKILNQDRVVISVTDNGTGMSEETLAKVFNPFFTTNEVGKGMGLGLSVSHTIIKNHGGNLNATSKFGEGSTFYFDLSC